MPPRSTTHTRNALSLSRVWVYVIYITSQTNVQKFLENWLLLGDFPSTPPIGNSHVSLNKTASYLASHSDVSGDLPIYIAWKLSIQLSELTYVHRTFAVVLKAQSWKKLECLHTFISLVDTTFICLLNHLRYVPLNTHFLYCYYTMQMQATRCHPCILVLPFMIVQLSFFLNSYIRTQTPMLFKSGRSEPHNNTPKTVHQPKYLL